MGYVLALDKFHACFGGLDQECEDVDTTFECLKMPFRHLDSVDMR